MAAGQDILSAALARGLPLPHSCREGRCASCKSRLLSGQISYPTGTLPPGITAAEAARGEVLLCQARPLGTLVIETRRGAGISRVAARATVIDVQRLSFDALGLHLRVESGVLEARPGQFIDVRSSGAGSARLSVIASRQGELQLEVAGDAGALREWLEDGRHAGESLELSGPFDTPR